MKCKGLHFRNACNLSFTEQFCVPYCVLSGCYSNSGKKPLFKSPYLNFTLSLHNLVVHEILNFLPSGCRPKMCIFHFVQTVPLYDRV